MTAFLPRLFLLALSSVIVSTLLYYQIKIVHLQQIILLLVAGLVVALRFLRNSVGKKIPTSWLLIFVLTFFVQLLIAATGAVFSPFFILIHLYVFGLALFFDFWTAFAFLVMELVVLFLNIEFDKKIYTLVNQDFASVLLYFSSIVVITPISKFISQQYHVKTDTLKLLFRELSTTESIIEQIDELVFTTNKNLILLSANDAALKIIDLPKGDNPLTDAVNLVDAKGKRLTKEGLLRSLAPLMQTDTISETNRLGLTIKGYTLKIPDQRISPKVVVRVSPVANQEGRLEKFIFVIGQTEGEENQDATDSKFQAAHLRYLSVLSALSHDPIISKISKINLYLDILKIYEKDMLIASKLDLDPKSLKIKLADILKITLQIQKQQQSLLQRLGIDYKITLPENFQEELRLAKANASLPEYLSGASVFSVTTDARLFEILMEKMFGILTSLAYMNKEGLPGGKACVELEFSLTDSNISLLFKTRINPKAKEKIQDYLGISASNLELTDNLPLSSGLESYLIKNIINFLGLSFKTEYNEFNNILTFNITVNKSFNRTAAKSN